MNLFEMIQNRYFKQSLNEFLLQEGGFKPEMLIMAAHNPNNVRYVWYYDEASKDIVGSSKVTSHDDTKFAEIASKDKCIRGRIFDFNGKTILMIYGSIAGFRDPSDDEMRDIYLKVVNEYPGYINYVVSETGKEVEIKENKQ